MFFIYFSLADLKLEHCKEWGGYVDWWRELERPHSLFVNLFVHLVLRLFEWWTWFYVTIQESLVISVVTMIV